MTPPPTAGVRSRVLQGTLLSLGGHGVNQALRLVSNLVLARLLSPEAFGIMAITWLVINGLTMASDVGIRSAVVRDHGGDDRAFLDTAWTLQILRGLLLAVVAASTAVPLSRFYDEPLLASIIPVAALTALFAGFESTRMLTLNRHLLLGRVVAIELAGQVFALLATVAYALVHASVWALVVGAVVASALRMLLTHLAIPGSHDRLRWDREAAGRIIAFGKWILVSTLITFLATRLDVLIVGKLLPMAVLGVYSIATLIAQVPATVASKLARAILLPLYSAARLEGGDSLPETYRTARRLVLPGGLLAVLSAAAFAPLFVRLLYPVEFHDASWIAQLSMLGLWFSFLQVQGRPAVIALGNSRTLAIANGVRLLVTAVACLLGFEWAGLAGLTVGVGVGAMGGYLVTALSLESSGIPALRLDAGYSLLGLGVALGSALGPGWFFDAETPLGRAYLTLALGLILMFPLAIVFALRAMAHLRGGRAEAGEVPVARPADTAGT